MRWKALVPIVLIFSMLLTACPAEEPTPTPPPGEPTPTPAPPADNDAAQGEEVFTTVAQPTCTTCHTVGEGDRVGPDLDGVATRAADRVAELTAEEYLRQAIAEPDAYVVEGFQPGVMPGVYREQLSAEQIDALVAYLMTLQ